MNKVVLITGASQGLGAHYAELFARNEYFVVVSGREQSQEKLEKLTKKIRRQGGRAIPFILDLNNFKSFDQKIGNLVKKVGKIDVLINNAGISADRSFFDITESDWDNHMDTNLKGLFFISQSVAKQMKSGGSIVNIAAVNGERIRRNSIAFGTSKAGVIHLTKAMAFELIPYNIRVNAISLGLFETEIVKDYIENDPSAKKYLEQIPTKRAGKLQELDGPILFLASEASSYMHGSILHVDGGFAINNFMP